MFIFDPTANKWDIIKPRGEIPQARDEHSACILNENMIVFGGFIEGEKTNTIGLYNFKDNRWTEFNYDDMELEYVPEARAGHSAVIHENKMYIYGGKDVDNKRLDDLWVFDFEHLLWEEVKVKART